MRTQTTFLLIFIFSLLVSACAGLPTAEGPTPTPETELTPSPATSDQVTPVGSENITITIWIAASLDGDSESFAGALLEERLQAFEASHPGVDIQIRTKSNRGPGGLLDALTSASSAAPGALPDLITLDPSRLALAANNDLLIPLDEFTDLPTPDDLYEFSVEPSRVDGIQYGVPIGAEVDVLGFQSDRFENPPLSWEAVLSEDRIFAFPANDPDAAFTITQYFSAGGQLEDDQGLPNLQSTPLTEVLSIYETGSQSGNIPASVIDLSTSDATWQWLMENRVDSSVVPLRSQLTSEDNSFLGAVPLPSVDGGTGLTITWNWGVVRKDSEQLSLLNELLTWLADPTFLGPWTYSLGLLPPTTGALAEWPDEPETALVNSLVTLVREKPDETTLSNVGPVLQTAVISVLTGQETASSAAIIATEQLSNP